MARDSKKHYGIYLSRGDPMIEKFDAIDGISEKLKQIAFDYFDGKLAYTKENESLDTKIKRQKFLKLCMENWQSMKKTHIAEEAQDIILGIKEIEEPQVTNVFEPRPQLTIQEMDNQFAKDPYCQRCKHNHEKNPTGDGYMCSSTYCLCGLRK